MKEVRKENHTPLVDYIVLAEFDIDTGIDVSVDFVSPITPTVFVDREHCSSPVPKRCPKLSGGLVC